MYLASFTQTQLHLSSYIIQRQLTGIFPMSYCNVWFLKTWLMQTFKDAKYPCQLSLVELSSHSTFST